MMGGSISTLRATHTHIDFAYIDRRNTARLALLVEE